MIRIVCPFSGFGVPVSALNVIGSSVPIVAFFIWFCDLPAAHVGDVVNTVGAGDALFASFLHFYAKGLHPVDCLNRAQIFAAAKIRTSGASNGFVTEAEVEEMLTWK